MKVTFLGVGEACDEGLPNTSLWVRAETEAGRSSVILDCGFTVPPLYFRQTADPEDLDGVWISHFHGDHFFGLPALLLRLWEMKRRKPLAIIGQTGIAELVERTMDLAYPHFLPKLAYPLRLISVEPGNVLSEMGLSWSFAENGHGTRDLAVRIDAGDRSLFYSGDGRATEETLRLARGCDLLVHEAFHTDESIPGHGTVGETVDFARRARASTLALVHIQREVRRDRYRDILDRLGRVEDFRALLPEPGDELEL